MTHDQARALLQWAMSERGGPAGSPARHFAGKGAHQYQTIGGTDPVGLSPTRIYAKETQRNTGAKIPTASGLSGSAVRKTLRDLPALHQLWLGYLYGGSVGFLQLERHARKDFESKHPMAGMLHRTRHIVAAMLESQIANAHGYHSFTLWSKVKPLWLDSVTQKQWHQTYSVYWKSVRSYLQALDSEALTAFVDRFERKP